MAKCKRCRNKAEIHVRHHNAAFCRSCFVFFFQRQVQRAIEKERMFADGERILIAVSGGKDSLALWDAVLELGYATTGVHLALGIGEYSALSTQKTVAYAHARQLPLIVVNLADEGVDIPTLSGSTNRPACAVCGTAKRHILDRVASENGFAVLATGHNLDDEAARLLGNVLRWESSHLAKQRPVLEPNHERFSRKVKPLFRLTEYETAAYAFFRGIDYVVDECPNSSGATQLIYKDVLNRLEAQLPGTRLRFVQEYLRKGQPAFAQGKPQPPTTCVDCGMPAFASRCSFCNLRRAIARHGDDQNSTELGGH
jgi:uncharacterized protein (TIGR00269 family)